jgi:hypothetical protein
MARAIDEAATRFSVPKVFSGGSHLITLQRAAPRVQLR